MKVKPIPEGYHTVTPYLIVKDAPRLLEFLKAAFNAEVKACSRGPDGVVMNAEVQIGDSMVMLADARPGVEATPSMLYLYVTDVDSVYKQAVKAGGKSVLEPADQFYGDRSGGVTDHSGNQWWIATRQENVSAEEVAKRAATAKK